MAEKKLTGEVYYPTNEIRRVRTEYRALGLETTLYDLQVSGVVFVNVKDNINSFVTFNRAVGSSSYTIGCYTTVYPMINS